MNPAILIDVIVVVVYFGLVIGIGLWMSRGQRSVEGFALGNREIAWWAVMASILASEISAGTFFGTPGEGFHLRNYTYLQLIVGYLLARVIVSFVFIPAYYRHNVVSIYEFLGTRFGPRTRRIASAVFLVTRLLASGTRLWVPTVIFVMMWHLSFPEMQMTPMAEFLLCGGALVFITLATAVYTTLGGIRAVIWTDVLQICVLFAALGFSLVYLISHVGGWEVAKPHLLNAQLWDWGTKASAGFWENVKNVLEQEYTVWAAFIASTCVTLATHGTDQDMVQRMLTAKNKRQSAVATILSGLIDIPITLCVLGIGILLAVHYSSHPDPLLPTQANGNIAPNQVFPYFILTAMPGGLRGLVIAGVLATAMGSLSTAINSLATSYVRDFHFRWFGEPREEAGKLRAFRLGTLLFSVLFIVVGLGTAWVSAMNKELRIVPIILGIFGYTYGSLLGIFLLGLFTRTRGSEFGNALGMLIGFIVVIYLSGLDRAVARLFGGEGLSRPAWVPEIEFPWRVFFGALTTFLIAVCFPTPGHERAGRSAEPAA
jgi:SSS family transporter